jgi:hypothetical protein
MVQFIVMICVQLVVLLADGRLLKLQYRILTLPDKELVWKEEPTLLKDKSYFEEE